MGRAVGSLCSPIFGVHFPNLPLFPAGRGSFSPTPTPVPCRVLCAKLTAAATSSGQDGRRAPWWLAGCLQLARLDLVCLGLGLGPLQPGLQGWGGAGWGEGGESRGLYFF